MLPMAFTSRMSTMPSSVDNCPGSGEAMALARQWRQARSQAIVVSQYTLRGAAS